MSMWVLVGRAAQGIRSFQDLDILSQSGTLQSLSSKLWAGSSFMSHNLFADMVPVSTLFPSIFCFWYS